MFHRAPLVAFVLLLSLANLANPTNARADAFDLYVNATLSKAAESPDASELRQLTPKEILEHDRVIPGIPATVLIVRTNEGRWAKLLVQSARQKIDAERALPMLLIERYVTYKEGEERTVLTSSKDVSLFPGFRLSLDLGQIVPEELGGDVRFVVEGSKVYAEPLGKARLFVLTKPVQGLEPKKEAKLVVGETFEPRYFNGTYKLYDDGRRSGTLKLTVGEDGGITGAYYSDKDGQKYEVRGKTGSPAHAIRFTVTFPRSEQVFQGMLFTGDARALAGTSRIAEREAAFYAVRVTE
jgi:hypothetical protein